MRKIIFSIIIVSFISTPLIAQDMEPTIPMGEQPQQVFKLGAGFVTLWKPYKGVDAEHIPFPLVHYQYQKLTIFGPTASYSFFSEDNQWALQGLARIRNEGYDDDDSFYLNGMSDRDPTIELGARFMYNLDFAVMCLDFTHDVLDEHRGYEFKFSLRKPFQNVFNIESLDLTPIAGINWRSKQLNDYYYGVKASEAIAGRPAYDVGGSIGYITGLQLDYQLTEKWTLLSLVNIEWLDSEISDSPIVEDDYSIAFVLGAMYEF